jgi:hypothetical protein
MIGDDSDLMSGTLKVLFPLRQGKNNSEKLLIVDIVISFSSNEHLGKVCTRMEIGVSILLK